MSALPAPYFEGKGVTLYHGDSFELLSLFPDRAFEMLFTDPPYGHNNNNGDLISRREAALGRKEKGKTYDPRPIAGDGPEAEENFARALREAARLVRCCCCCCCCCGGGPDPMFARWSLRMDEAFDFCQMVIWDKGPMGMGFHYRRSYETVLVGYAKGLKKKPFYDTSHRVENIIRPGMGIKKIIPQKNDHPTPKPPELAAFFMRLHTRPGETVLDPFAGGGSTGIAAIREGRRAVLIEIDERWCEMAAKKLSAEGQP